MEWRRLKEEAQAAAEDQAQKIVTLAIERVAVEQVVARTTSQVRVADEGIKGRIIGQEGRNIKAFEAETGMQLLVNNDDPHVLIVSGFNPVAREIARRALDRLIQGGSIAPQRIQSLTKRVAKQIKKEMDQAGLAAFKRLKLKAEPRELVSLVGRLKFRTSYGQNVLNHSIEVAELCSNMAAELGLNARMAKRAGLLHDIGKALDVEREGTHPELGGEAARKFKEHEVVINAIESHHEDVEVIHPISVLVAVCDAVSGSRPGARRASQGDYLKRIETLESMAKAFPEVKKSYALQAGREVRVMIEPTKADDDRLPLLASELAKKIGEEMDFPGRIKITMIRSRQAVEYSR